MPESQNTEYKESWRDEYLKWVCGFANAAGGRIYIGVRDDGKVVGVHNSKRFIEEIPSKIKDTMGILADVNLLKKDGLDYIEIIVNPCSYPVNYRGVSLPQWQYKAAITRRSSHRVSFEKDGAALGRYSC